MSNFGSKRDGEGQTWVQHSDGQVRGTLRQGDCRSITCSCQGFKGRTKRAGVSRRCERLPLWVIPLRSIAVAWDNRGSLWCWMFFHRANRTTPGQVLSLLRTRLNRTINMHMLNSKAYDHNLCHFHENTVTLSTERPAEVIPPNLSLDQFNILDQKLSLQWVFQPDQWTVNYTALSASLTRILIQQITFFWESSITLVFDAQYGHQI